MKHEGVFLLSADITRSTNMANFLNYTKSVLVQAGIIFESLKQQVTKEFDEDSCKKIKTMLAECRFEKKLRHKYLIYALLITVIVLMTVFYKFVEVFTRPLKVLNYSH